MRYARAQDGYWVNTFIEYAQSLLMDLQFRTVNMHSGDVAYYTIDSLSAFWPGLQVLAGDVQNAIKLHMIC